MSSAKEGDMSDRQMPTSVSSKVSLKDIAHELGISQTAVSFAINNRPGVSEETKKAVLRTAERMGWRPIYAAQALSSSRTMSIGFAPVFYRNSTQDEAFMLQFMTGVHSSLSTYGYSLLFRPLGSEKEEAEVYSDWGRRKRVDGVILINLRVDDSRPKLLKDLHIPAVLAGGPDENDDIPSLSIDDSATMGTILDHLYVKGHRRIAYLSGDPKLSYSVERVNTFRRFASEKHLDRVYVEYTDLSTTKAVEATQHLLTSDEPPTAFIYESEVLAVAGMRFLNEIFVSRERQALHSSQFDTNGVHYPQTLPAVVSFEDSFVCSNVYPSITAVHRDAGQYGAKVAGLLLKVLAGEKVSGNRKILTPHLVVRESTSLPNDL
jgi:DNA-binding LacI/PurR family transcriptional regulator